MNKSCIILFGAALKERVVELLGPEWGMGNEATCCTTDISGRYHGFMDCDIDNRPVWYERQPGYRELPLFDARTQWAELCEFLGKEGEETKMKNETIETECIIKVVDQAVCDKIQDMAFKAGYRWDFFSNKPEKKKNIVSEYGSDSIIFGDWWQRGQPKQIMQGKYVDNVQAKPDWLALDSATDMEKIEQFFAGQMKRAVTIDRIVQPRLLELIRNNPQNELVVGFVRRDLRLALPVEVQQNGADAICEWIIKEKLAQGGDIEAKKKSNKFRLVINESVSGRDYWSRLDDVTLEGDVPEEIINRAIANNDYEIIEEWMVDNRANLNEIRRYEGDQQYGDGDIDDYEFEKVSEECDLEDQFNDYRGE
jgi:hypothetical protein